jgi:hypothetical protein
VPSAKAPPRKAPAGSLEAFEKEMFGGRIKESLL